MFVRFRPIKAERYASAGDATVTSDRICADKCKDRPRYYPRYGVGCHVKGRTFLQGCPMKPLCPLAKPRHRWQGRTDGTEKKRGRVNGNVTRDGTRATSLHLLFFAHPNDSCNGQTRVTLRDKNLFSFLFRGQFLSPRVRMWGALFPRTLEDQTPNVCIVQQTIAIVCKISACCTHVAFVITRDRYGITCRSTRFYPASAQSAQPNNQSATSSSDLRALGGWSPAQRPRGSLR